MKNIIYLLEYFVIRVVYFLVANLPYFVLNIVSYFFYLLIRVLAYRSKVIDINLAIAFPEKTQLERNVLKIKFYRSLSIFFLEFFQAPSLSENFLKKNVIIENDDVLKKYQGKQFLVISAHYGEFSLFLMMISRLIKTHLNVIMKEQHNPYSNDFMKQQRVQSGQRPILARGALKRCIDLLKSGEYLGFLNDQNAWDEGLDVPFFSKEAPTMKGLAMLGEKFNLPILQGYCVREKFGKYRFWIEELKLEKQATKDETYYHILAVSNKHLEDAIKRYPEQYLWSHKRWKLKY